MNRMANVSSAQAAGKTDPEEYDLVILGAPGHNAKWGYSRCCCWHRHLLRLDTS